MFGQWSVWLLVLAGLALASARNPPLDLAQRVSKDLPRPVVDFGLTGIDMSELWKKHTLPKAGNPSLVHPSLNGAASPTTVAGIKMKTIKGREVNAFLGIKYGKAPEGNLRFKKTEPAGVYWTGETLDATHLGEKCPQRSMLAHIPSGSEDCLNLNVYTPYLPGENADPLPVMMFIHGGAFISGDSSLYMPTKLLDQDVILVVIHYRLGTLGFFCLNTEDAPGNAALWDQIEAMRWIRDNIEGFGGDKNRVTIFGESAGSASVNYHLLLPESRGLFHRVIGESGSALEHWSHDPDPITSAELIGAANGCSPDDHAALYDCMMKLSADDLAMTMDQFVSEDRQRGEMGFRGAAPVTQVAGLAGSLVTKLPEEYFADGDVADVPLMIGANKHEGSFVLGIMYTAFLVPNEHMEDDVYKREQMLADLLNAFGVTDQTHGMAASIEDAYLMGVDPADFETAAPGLIDMAGVFFLKAGAWRTAKLHANGTSAGTFVYSFDYESDDSMFRWLFMGYEGMPFRAGVTHADDLMYLFSLPADLDTEEQLRVKDYMVTLWTNFAIHGNPTPSAAQESWRALQIPQWLPVTNEDRNYMLIQDTCSVELEYSKRWHIAMQEDGPTSPTSPPTGMTSAPGPTQEEYDALARESQAYMISMIAFVVATVGLAGLSFFFFKKTR
ncbi:juvenile hormone esterase-like [Penaeus chinensis]|uniref:juvenile hormone esterase-like n=1 Tax=Penaeus chinensis TaxID=139456 RepID=UPI001FB72323|nr:juvenile hormone esterase-like [Penaeus chinensis]